VNSELGGASAVQPGSIATAKRDIAAINLRTGESNHLIHTGIENRVVGIGAGGVEVPPLTLVDGEPAGGHRVA
jgi:hypothetical protein